jgi:hypothetical protein
MSKRRNERHDNHRPSDGWRALAAQARRAAPGVPCAPPPGFVERLLAGRAMGVARLARRDHERLIAWAACLTLAASLVLVLWNWPELKVAWSGPPAVADAWAQVEPWL